MLKCNMDLKNIQAPIKPLLDEVDAVIKNIIKQNDIEIIKKISQFHPHSSGKKIRSTLFFLLAGMNQSLSDNHAKIAAPIELFHLSSLVHDDIVDNSEFRRGKKTLNFNFGNYRSVLWGDFLFITSLQIIETLNRPFIMKSIVGAAREMIEGQLLEVQHSFNYELDRATYFKIIHKKTSSLFGSVAEISMAMKHENSDMVSRFLQFGLNFGMIFQISDDMLDIFSSRTGKDRFRDLQEGKITLPYIYLIEKYGLEVSQEFSVNNLKKLQTLFAGSDIKQHCLDTIDAYYSDCMDLLNEYPDSDYKRSLVLLLDFIKNRDY